MPKVPRKVMLPIVSGVWFITLLVAGYTCAILPWFLDCYDYYQRNIGAILYGVATTLLHYCYLAGVPVTLCVIGYGVQLLRSVERRATHVLWYVVLSLTASAFWFFWTLLAERTFHNLLFPA